jgi:hypothetical protein
VPLREQARQPATMSCMLTPLLLLLMHAMHANNAAGVLHTAQGKAQVRCVAGITWRLHPREALTAAQQPCTVCSTWFNSRLVARSAHPAPQATACVLQASALQLAHHGGHLCADLANLRPVCFCVACGGQQQAEGGSRHGRLRGMVGQRPMPRLHSPHQRPVCCLSCRV